MGTCCSTPDQSKFSGDKYVPPGARADVVMIGKQGSEVRLTKLKLDRLEQYKKDLVRIENATYSEECGLASAVR